MSLKKLYEDYDKEFTKSFNEYLALHKELDKYRNINLTDDLILKVNPIIAAIQDKFIELHPALNNIIQRYQPCALLVQDYNEFMEHIKKGGAVPEDEVNDEAKA